MDLNIDNSWIDFENKISSCNQQFREPLSSISSTCIYIDTLSNIHHVSKDVIDIHSEAIIHKDTLLQFIQNKQFHDNKKYKLEDVLSFQVDLDDTQILSSNFDFFKSISYLNDIQCIPSIFCFHDIASLYFIFYQVPPVKSILKKANSAKTTKKVRINESTYASSKKFVKNFKKTFKKHCTAL
jgi:hypothetical protein